MLACLLHRSRGPYTRRTNAAKQRTVAYTSGRGQRRQMFLLLGAPLITLVMPLHWPESANMATSVCLYREQERSLRCRPIIRPRVTMGLGSPILGVWLAIASPFRLVHHGAGDPAAACHFACPSSRDVDRLSSGGSSDSPTRPPGADGHCASLVALPL